MCKGTGLPILKSPLSFTQIEDKTFLFQSPRVEVELFRNSEKRALRSPTDQFWPIFSTFRRDVDTFSPVIYSTVAEPIKRRGQEKLTSIIEAPDLLCLSYKS